jgi:hypothetical protein
MDVSKKVLKIEITFASMLLLLDGWGRSVDWVIGGGVARSVQELQGVPSSLRVGFERGADRGVERVTQLVLIVRTVYLLSYDHW